MDGAILYDMKENSYLMKYQISESQAERMADFLTQRREHFFINTVVDDAVVIYYDTLDNEAQKKIFASKRRSPYRNYVHTQSPAISHVFFCSFVITQALNLLTKSADSSGEILTILLTDFANTAMTLASFLFDDYIIHFVVFIFKKNRLKSILTIPETEIRCNGIPRYHIVGPGVSSMTTDFRNGIDVMTTETTCLSPIWRTDEDTKKFLNIHGRGDTSDQFQQKQK